MWQQDAHYWLFDRTIASALLSFATSTGILLRSSGAYGDNIWCKVRVYQALVSWEPPLTKLRIFGWPQRRLEEPHAQEDPEAEAGAEAGVEADLEAEVEAEAEAEEEPQAQADAFAG